MDFYEMLGQYYDVIFPANAMHLAFLKAQMPERGRVLDVGCATGTYAIPFARLGYDVYAIDLDSPMVESLVAKTESDDNPPKALVYDMNKLGNLTVGPFDLIYAIGNTIVHLATLDEVEGLFRACLDKLREGSSMVIQIVNYDRVLSRREMSLPMIERQEGRLRFHRNYEQSGANIIFEGRLEVEGEGVFEAKTTLLPILSGELIDRLKRAGFSQVTLLGGFDGSVHDMESPATVVVATK
ncbi:MAG: class I SAM-dependent methyltransferase [Erysipelotrichaceae bacterium]|nr:class I SAM-dependent methyltransferase [Erysipelotrichaceae bacterium]